MTEFIQANFGAFYLGLLAVVAVGAVLFMVAECLHGRAIRRSRSWHPCINCGKWTDGSALHCPKCE